MKFTFVLGRYKNIIGVLFVLLLAMLLAIGLTGCSNAGAFRGPIHDYVMEAAVNSSGGKLLGEYLRRNKVLTYQLPQGYNCRAFAFFGTSSLRDCIRYGSNREQH